MPKITYASIVAQKILDLESREAEKFDEASLRIFESLKGGGVWNIFGSGHSHMAAEEAFHRAGGLIQVNPWLEEYLMPHMGPTRSGGFERLTGIAQVIFDFYNPKKSEILTIISNSGINSIPVELAVLSRKAGLFVIAITALEHSKKATSRHAGGKKLYEVCDLVIDTGGVFGDAAIAVSGLDVSVGPMSSLLSMTSINSLTVRICELYSKAGLKAPVYLSANVAGGEARNKALEEAYRERIYCLR